jgi:hypothetical protein
MSCSLRRVATSKKSIFPWRVEVHRLALKKRSSSFDPNRLKLNLSGANCDSVLQPGRQAGEQGTSVSCCGSQDRYFFALIGGIATRSSDSRGRSVLFPVVFLVLGSLRNNYPRIARRAALKCRKNGPRSLLGLLPVAEAEARAVFN